MQIIQCLHYIQLGQQGRRICYSDSGTAAAAAKPIAAIKLYTVYKSGAKRYEYMKGYKIDDVEGNIPSSNFLKYFYPSVYPYVFTNTLVFN